MQRKVDRASLSSLSLKKTRGQINFCPNLCEKMQDEGDLVQTSGYRKDITQNRAQIA